jgi:hypothetical protein
LAVMLMPPACLGQTIQSEYGRAGRRRTRT